VRLVDLYLACACVQGDNTAVEYFVQHCGPTIRRVLKTLAFEDSEADDLEARLLEHLLVRTGGGGCRLGQYEGRADLRAWVQAAAVRLAASARRGKRREVLLEEMHLSELAIHASQDHNLVEKECLAHVQRALAAAFDSLSSRERNLLRHQVVSGLTIDEIGLIYGTHRATAARWLERVRHKILGEVRRALVAELRLTEAEVDSMLTLVRSQLDGSLCRALVDSTSGQPLDG